MSMYLGLYCHTVVVYSDDTIGRFVCRPHAAAGEYNKMVTVMHAAFNCCNNFES